MEILKDIFMVLGAGVAAYVLFIIGFAIYAFYRLATRGDE